jgi:cell division transport system permease protein
MRKLLYSIGKFFRHLYKRPLPAIASLLSMLLLYLMFDLVWISSLSVDKYYEQVLSEVDMEIFLEDNLPDSSMNAITDALKDLDGIEAFEFISKDDARARLHALMGMDLLEGLDDNPLPKSILITFDMHYITSQYLNDTEVKLRRFKGVTEIFYPRFWLEKAEANRLLISRSVFIIAIVIFLTAVLNLLYSVRLSVKTYDEELLQYRLLGAGKTFLSIPFIFEGIFYSLIAFVAGWLIIFYAVNNFAISNFEILLPPQIDIIRACLVALVIGIVGGFIGVRRSL